MPEVVARLRVVAEQAGKFLETGDAQSALAVLDALTDEVMAGWTNLDDSDGAASGFFGDLHTLWIEALLAADPSTANVQAGQALKDAERLAWAQRLAGWQNELRDYEMDDVFDEPFAILRRQWKHPARRLLEQGTSKDYDQAVCLLAMAQAAALAAGRLEAWQADLDELIAVHSRKRQLVAVLRQLRRRRRPR